MQLPLLQTADQTLSQMQTRWKSILDVPLANPFNNISLLSNVVLKSGNNQIAHLLGRLQMGWFITDINGAATIYRYQPLTSTYLYLNSSAAVTISLGVF